MRSFIVLCLVAVACAQYNYEPSGPAAGAGDLSAPIAPANSDNVGAVAPQAELEKEYYTYTANDNDFNDYNGANEAANSLKKAVRVVFIKGPENRGLEDAALALAKQAGEQQTAIYVLNKQADIGDLANKLNNINHSGNSRPEVHFVKYRTPEDAANAQRAIQSQYDNLGGNSKTINGGVAPVLNFASKAPVAAAAPTNAYIPPPATTNAYIPPAPVSPPSKTYIPSAASVAEPETNYLPASILRLFRL